MPCNRTVAMGLLTFVFICILCLISMIDIYKQEIPDGCILTAIVAKLFYYFVVEGFAWDSFFLLWVNAISIAGPLLFLTVMIEKIKKKDALGGGDIKLVFVTGMYLGWERNLWMMLIASVIGIVSACWKKRDNEGRCFPFGPYICVATIFCMLF